MAIIMTKNFYEVILENLYIREEDGWIKKTGWRQAVSELPHGSPQGQIFFLPQNCPERKFGSKKSTTPWKTSRNRRLCVLPAYQK